MHDANTCGACGGGGCLFCTGDRSDPGHDARCDGRQGLIENNIERARQGDEDPLSDDEEAEAARFALHCAEHPEVYVILRRFALQAKHSGRRRLGIRTLYERVRWYTAIEATDVDYKLNDRWHAFYARLLMQREPELRDFFETRTSMADRILGEAR